MTEIDLGIDGLSDYKEIGSGGFATVYTAFELALDRPVAVKVLAAIDDAGRRRFDRERQSMGRTSDHPNIATLLRSGYTSPENKPYLVMEYLSGGSLQDRLDSEGAMPWADAVQLILPVAEALAFTHSSGIIHRDVKPANILISRTGAVKLTDFGIAAIRESTATSQVAYSLLYTAPETFDARYDPSTGELIDPRTEQSDLYSLAATLYALITGGPPFQGSSPADLMRQIITRTPPPVGSPQIDDFFSVAMAKHPADRHVTASHFIDGLKAIAAPAPASGEHEPTARSRIATTVPADAGLAPDAHAINSQDLTATIGTTNPLHGRKTKLIALAASAVVLVIIVLLSQASRGSLSFLSSLAPGTTDSTGSTGSSVQASSTTASPDETTPANQSENPKRGVAIIEAQSPQADDFMRYLIEHDGKIVELNHQLMGEPGPGDVTIDYACDPSTGCSSVRVQDSQVTFQSINGGVWFKGCYGVVVDGNGYGAKDLDIELTRRGATCPT